MNEDIRESLMVIGDLLKQLSEEVIELSGLFLDEDEDEGEDEDLL